MPWSSWPLLWSPEEVTLAFEAYPQRLLKQWREGPNLRAICELLGTRHDELLLVAQQVAAGFDLENAVGVQLDAIGRVLGLARLGDDDDRYRLALQVWAMCLSTQGTANELLAIVRAYIGATPTLSLVMLPPMGYRLEIDDLDLEDLQRLLVFVRAASPICYGFAVVITADTSGLLVDLATPTVASAHNVDVIGVAVTDPGTTATIFT